MRTTSPAVVGLLAVLLLAGAGNGMRGSRARLPRREAGESSRAAGAVGDDADCPPLLGGAAAGSRPLHLLQVEEHALAGAGKGGLLGGAMGALGGAMGSAMGGSCCQVCAQKFYNELSLLQLTADVEQLVVDRFHDLHMKMRPGVRAPPAGTPLSLLLQLSASSEERAAVAAGAGKGGMGGSKAGGGGGGGAKGGSGGSKSGGADDKGGAGKGGAPQPVGQPNGGACCKICPARLLPVLSDYDATQYDTRYLHMGLGPGSPQPRSGSMMPMMLLQTAQRSRERKRLPRGRGLLTDVAAASATAAEQPAVSRAQPDDAATLRRLSKPSAALLQTRETTAARKGGMGGSKGGAGGKGGGADSKGGMPPMSRCCNICPATRYPQRDYSWYHLHAREPVVASALLQQAQQEQAARATAQAAVPPAEAQSRSALLALSSRTSKGGSSSGGGAKSGSGGAGECCKMCASNFYESMSPFSEPHAEPSRGPYGKRAQNPRNRHHKAGDDKAGGGGKAGGGAAGGKMGGVGKF